jgi:PAS domain S-box-containing protein
LAGVLDPGFLGLLLVAFLVGSMLARRDRLGYWAAGWAALVAGGILAGLSESGWRPLGFFFSSLFPAFVLAGTFQVFGRGAPRVLLPAAAAIGVARAACFAAGWSAATDLLALLVEPTLIAAAAAVAYREGRALPGSLRRALLPLALVVLAGVEAYDAVGGLLGVQTPWAAWLALGGPVIAIQQVRIIERSRELAARSRDAATRSLERLRAITDSAYDLIAEVDLQGRFHYASPGYGTALGYEPEELVGTSIMDLTHPDVIERARAEQRELQRARTPDGIPEFTGRVRHRDGSWRWFESTARTFRTSEGEVRVLLVSRDVTARMLAEEQRRESERRFHALAEHSSDMISEIGPDGRVEYVSANSERILGTPAESLVGLSVSELVSRFGLSPGALSPSDTLEQVVERGPFDQARQVRDAQGNLRWMETAAVDYRTSAGELRAIAVSRDLTERVRMAQQIQQTQKLESLAVLAGGIAHDLNNLLAVILGNAGIAEEALAEGSSDRGALEEIASAAECARDLTQQLLAYAGRQPQDSEPVDLSELVRKMARLLETTIPPDVQLDYELSPSLLAVEGDAGEFRQLVMNLIHNAVEAISGDGNVTLRTSELKLDAEALGAFRLGAELTPGRYVVLEVVDTGVGMDEDTRSRIFDPFYSTKSLGRGLGLASLLGIVRSHGGGLCLESTPGKGTRFVIAFPASGRRPQAPRVERDQPRTQRGRGTVLVADDEEAVRRVAVRTLEASGFRTLVASDGREAVELFRAHAQEIVAVVLDHVMPVLDGAGALREIRSLGAQTPVIVTSGVAAEEFVQDDRGPTSFLPKPYRTQRLADEVFAALDLGGEST